MDPKLTAAFITAIAFDILMPLALASWLKHRFGVSWRMFGYGALVFFVSQMVLRIPLVEGLQFFFAPQLQSSEALLTGWLIILSFSAGLFEETGRYIGYRYLVGPAKTWENALMYGAGHGGVESMVLVGGTLLLTLIQAIAIQGIDPTQLPITPEEAAQLSQLQEYFRQMAWWMPLVGAYERLMAMTLHLVLSVIVLQVFLRKSLNWLWLAIGYHGIANLGAVLLGRQAGPLWAEVFLTALAVLNIYFIMRLRPVQDVAEERAS